MTRLLKGIHFDRSRFCLLNDSLVTFLVKGWGELIEVNGHYLSTETDFVERRRRGLSRFMNSIVRHPILRDDDVVVAFITVPTVLF